ncbi:hypothetical protein [Candidatus Accumulibacter sp. ACC007]|uniref:hypothetical protein n=1 Tax=Candidatus Accumulibacter sp. ACC007 TaxID=2823333 RepID=UPI0025BF8305|nr:hypothetical protein [Candidatus Accumulibacter sp. ACC007]
MLAYVAYDIQIAEATAYLGLVSFGFTLTNLLVGVVWIILVWVFYSNRLDRPSDWFLLLRILFVCTWGSTLWQVSGTLDAVKGLLMMVIVFFLLALFFLPDRLNLYRSAARSPP